MVLEISVFLLLFLKRLPVSGFAIINIIHILNVQIFIDDNSFFKIKMHDVVVTINNNVGSSCNSIINFFFFFCKLVSVGIRIHYRWRTLIIRN